MSIESNKMTWQYKNNAQVVGPLSEQSMVELHACGMLADDTLVRREGTEEWLPFDKAFEKGGAPPELLIKFHCSNCKTKIAAGLADAGTSANCPSCGKELMVPPFEASQPPTAHPSDPESQRASDDSATHQPETDELPSNSAVDLSRTAPGEVSPMHKFGTTLASFAKSAAHDVKLSSQTAVLQTRIENAKKIELRKAHYALGRKLYEARIFLSMQDEIEGLERQLAEKGERAVIEENETKGAMLKRVGKNAAKSAESGVLSLKLKQSLTHLGEFARNLPEGNLLPDIKAEMEFILSVESKIQHFEEKVSSLATTRPKNNYREFPQNALASELKYEFDSQNQTTFRVFFRRVNTWLRNHLIQPRYAAAITVLLVVLLVVRIYSKKPYEDPRKTNSHQERVVAHTDFESSTIAKREPVPLEVHSQSRSKYGSAMDGAMRLLSSHYPELSESELIQRLEGIIGRPIRSSRDAKIARSMLEVQINSAISLGMKY